MADMQFSLQKEDWSLHRQGQQDQERHKEKVKEAIKENLADLISDESIIMSDGRKITKIPIRSLEEYRFRYNFNKNGHVGSGDGDSQVGDVVANDPADEAGQAKQGQGAGNRPGVDYYEAAVSMEEVESILFSELELPNLAPKSADQMVLPQPEFRDVRKTGLTGNIDKRRTILASIRRNQMNDTGRLQIGPDDLRYKTWEDRHTPDSNAVVLAMMDTSGSMGMFEKYCARTFFFWMTRFLRTKYDSVQIVYIAHHTEANEVSEEQFFTKGESGGTICSSAYDLATRLIDQRYPPSQYNLYPIHFSDGDNLTSDNDRCLQLVNDLCGVSQMFGYAEVNQYNRTSTLSSAFSKLGQPNFRTAIIHERSGVYGALRKFFTAKLGEVTSA